MNIKLNLTKSVLAILFVFTMNFSYSQQWEVLNESDSYIIEQQHIVCKSSQGFDYDYVVIKYTNLTNSEIDLAFDMEVWYGDVCSSCNDADNEKHGLSLITIPANSSVQGDCNSSNKKMKVFDHSITRHPNAYKGELSKVVYSNLQVLNK